MILEMSFSEPKTDDSIATQRDLLHWQVEYFAREVERKERISLTASWLGATYRGPTA